MTRRTDLAARGARRSDLGARAARRVAVAGAKLAVIAGALAALAACGGRRAHPVALERETDALLTCSMLAAERSANLRRIEDLKGERVANTVRTLSRVPGAILTGPASAIIFADPSIAIFREIAALQRRNERLVSLSDGRGCVDASDKPELAEAAVGEEATVETGLSATRAANLDILAGRDALAPIIAAWSLRPDAAAGASGE